MKIPEDVHLPETHNFKAFKVYEPHHITYFFPINIYCQSLIIYDFETQHLISVQTRHKQTEDSDTIRSDTHSFWHRSWATVRCVSLLPLPGREWVTSPPPSPHPLGQGWPPGFAFSVYYLHGERGAALSVGPHMDRNLGVVG